MRLTLWENCIIYQAQPFLHLSLKQLGKINVKSEIWSKAGHWCWHPQPVLCCWIITAQRTSAGQVEVKMFSCNLRTSHLGVGNCLLQRIIPGKTDPPMEVDQRQLYEAFQSQKAKLKLCTPGFLKWVLRLPWWHSDVAITTPEDFNPREQPDSRKERLGLVIAIRTCGDLCVFQAITTL